MILRIIAHLSKRKQSMSAMRNMTRSLAYASHCVKSYKELSFDLGEISILLCEFSSVYFSHQNDFLEFFLNEISFKGNAFNCFSTHAQTRQQSTHLLNDQQLLSTHLCTSFSKDRPCWYLSVSVQSWTVQAFLPYTFYESLSIHGKDTLKQL